MATTPKAAQQALVAFDILACAINEGLTLTEAADRKKVPYSTFLRWFRSDLVQAEVEARVTALAQQTTALLVDAWPLALQNLVSMATGKRGRPSDQLAAIRELRSLLGLKSPADVVKRRGDTFDEFLQHFSPTRVELSFDFAGQPPVDRERSAATAPELPEVVDGQLLSEDGE